MLKMLAVLSVLQFGLLVFLLGKVAGVDTQLERLTTVGGAQTSLRDTSGQPVVDFAVDNYISSESELRSIVREELAAQLSTMSGVAAGSASPQTVAYKSDPAEQARNQKQFESVTQKIEYYESVGTISEFQMQQLQSEIVKLSPAARKEAFTLLMRTMSSGALEGQL